MMETILTVGKQNIPLYSLNTVVVGTGAAGYNTASRLHGYGQTDIAIVTEAVNAGTSRNSGSDKQTYYKLTLAGGEADSVAEMTQTLFAGGCVDGDTALCEAALSAQSFLRLVELGVPFPQNRYGEFVGYKTDHDPCCRATSAGPYTSRFITERLQVDCAAKHIRVFDRLQVVRVLRDEQACRGLLCLDLSAPKPAFVAFNCTNVVFATGGPAGIYAHSVYPESQHGATGLAFEAGVMGQNLTEWQFGLASIRPRWNVSGTYMQVLPRFVSTNADGGDEKEFLNPYFQHKGEMLTKVFLKGYQWPFDVRKLENGSSIIDVLVSMESAKGRRVFLDFRKNPGGGRLDFTQLAAEAYEYLSKAEACFGTPAERLAHMNQPAIDFYREKGVDITSEPLEIALSAQHNNGGLAVDCWWQTNLPGFFAVGEVAGTHGIYRPGGSALNAGQVGSTRAAMYIAGKRRGSSLKPCDFIDKVIKQIAFIQELTFARGEQGEAPEALIKKAGERMNRYGGAVVSREGIQAAVAEVVKELALFPVQVNAQGTKQLSAAFALRDILLTQRLYLTAKLEYIERRGKSRGSTLYSDPAGNKPHTALPDIYKFLLDEGDSCDMVQQTALEKNSCKVEWRKVRSIPDDNNFFETVWRQYRVNHNVF